MFQLLQIIYFPLPVVQKPLVIRVVVGEVLGRRDAPISTARGEAWYMAKFVVTVTVGIRTLLLMFTFVHPSVQNT